MKPDSHQPPDNAIGATSSQSPSETTERVAELIDSYGYHAFGGSDAHLVSFVGICATEFEKDITNTEELVDALRTGGYRPVDFRLRRTPVLNSA